MKVDGDFGDLGKNGDKTSHQPKVSFQPGKLFHHLSGGYTLENICHLSGWSKTLQKMKKEALKDLREGKTIPLEKVNYRIEFDKILNWYNIMQKSIEP